MNEPRWMSRKPQTILLATDLSPRCDRALDRAVFLAEQWQSKLVIMHVLEDASSWASETIVPSWRRPPDPFAIAQRRLIEDVGAAAEIAAIVIEEGDPADAIQRTAEARDCDLIITGVARDEPFGRFALGTTVDQLLRNSSLPILVVKNRVRHAYRNILVATDFSEASRHSLEMAVRYFPGQKLTIFHAYDPPMSSFANDSTSYRRQYRTAVEAEYEAFINSTPSAELIRKHARPLLEFGAPDQLLRDCCRDTKVDLVVLGTEGRSALFEIFVGSVAKQIMAELPCDALVVREPAATGETG
jgi:nucleotide-binding universal stress UspA family protein